MKGKRGWERNNKENEGRQVSKSVVTNDLARFSIHFFKSFSIAVGKLTDINIYAYKSSHDYYLL